jgi:hypothetical protein
VAGATSTDDARGISTPSTPAGHVESSSGAKMACPMNPCKCPHA